MSGPSSFWPVREVADRNEGPNRNLLVAGVAVPRIHTTTARIESGGVAGEAARRGVVVKLIKAPLVLADPEFRRAGVSGSPGLARATDCRTLLKEDPSSREVNSCRAGRASRPGR